MVGINYNLKKYSNLAQTPLKTKDLETTLSRNLTPREKRDCEIVESLIRGYFSIVRKTIQDTVPKAIMMKMVNHVRVIVF